jgi:spermidine/putrescine-binding protein
MLGAASPLLLSACSSGSNSGGGSSGGGTLNWLTWSDHYSTDQLAKVAASTKITGRPKLFSDNADAFLQLKQTGPQFDQVSADALWVKKYMESGLIQPFDLSSIGASSELYSMAKNFDFLNDPKGAPDTRSRIQFRSTTTRQVTCADIGESPTDPLKGRSPRITRPT